MKLHRPIAIFYHCLFWLGEPKKVLPLALWIVQEQMDVLSGSGLLAAAEEFHVGVNGGSESTKQLMERMPVGAKFGEVKFHGLDCRSENLTILMLEEWVKTHPGWNVLYFHSKGATKPIWGKEGMLATYWRNGMMADMVCNWRQCVTDLALGYDIVCSSWLWRQGDGTQNIPAGNFLWVKSEFVAKLPSILTRARIQQDGIGALSSRYEAEVYWGNGPTPKVKEYRYEPHWYARTNR